MNKHIQHHSGDEITSELKNRQEFIEGKIEAGNNNKELLNELREVLMKSYHYNIISLIAVKKYLKQFK